MRHFLPKIAVFTALASSAGSALAQAPPPPAHPGILGRLFHHPAQPGTTGQRPMFGSAMRPGMTSSIAGGVVGNRNSHVYHLPGDKGALPAAKNRVFFRSAAEAEAAGYHRAGSGTAHHSSSTMRSGRVPSAASSR